MEHNMIQRSLLSRAEQLNLFHSDDYVKTRYIDICITKYLTLNLDFGGFPMPSN